jgi:hypothetical protein
MADLLDAIVERLREAGKLKPQSMFYALSSSDILID